MKQDAYLLIGQTLDNNKNIATIYQKKTIILYL